MGIRKRGKKWLVTAERGSVAHVQIDRCEDQSPAAGLRDAVALERVAQSLELGDDGFKPSAEAGQSPVGRATRRTKGSVSV